MKQLCSLLIFCLCSCTILAGILETHPLSPPLLKEERGKFSLETQFLNPPLFPREGEAEGGDEFINATDSNYRVGFITLKDYSENDNEVKAAYDFLRSCKGYSSSLITFKEIKKDPKLLNQFNALWFHRPDTTAFSDIENEKKVLHAIREYLEKGGNLLLSLDAFRYLLNLGLETVPPEIRFKSCIDEGYGRRLGFHGFRDHPVFQGMNGGAYVNRPDKDVTVRQVGYFDNHLPAYGKVVAVDWDYIFFREDTKLILEYDIGKGKILATGSYTYFSMPNYNRDHLELFFRNTFHYLITRNPGSEIFYWDYEPNKVLEFSGEYKPKDISFSAIPESKLWITGNGPLTLTERFSSGNYWDVAGERMLTMGNENGGIEEIWAHPFMAFRDYEVGIKFDYKDTIFWLNDERPQIEVNPSFFSRIYKFPRAYLTEIIVDDPVRPAGVIHYEYKGVYRAELIVKVKSNLRLMWPYSERVLGTLFHAIDTNYHAFVVKDKSGDFVAIIGGNKKPGEMISGQYAGFSYNSKNEGWKGIPTDQFQVMGLVTYSFKMNDRMDIVCSATNEGYDQTKKDFVQTIRDPQSIIDNEILHTKDLLEKSLEIISPDKEFNQGYKWALIATDRFFVHTPGMGKSMVAGYATTKKGWDGGQKVNGRPGYGWYFGRDGEWSGFALLDYGDFEKVKAELEFYQKYQDLSGKIFHEATTSGVVHYDAADATPLYIILAGKYFRHTNDTAFLRKSWPNIKKAVNFCFSTDTDKDHLIENTNVGHGWVEGGELYGSHATLYMAGCWADALEETSNMAHFMKDDEEASYHRESGIVRDIINTDFWNKDNNFYSYGKNKDGSFRSEPTVLPAVPLYFRFGNAEKAKLVLNQYASNAFTTNWGTRIIRDDSPYFNPAGYHYGSVWPLFTGWTAMAEFNYGNYPQGFSHLMNNLKVYKNWGQGFVEEVLNGAEYKPSGVCIHQCWSETMVLQPAIEGLLGLEIRAQENKVILAPHTPANWDSLTVENILIGQQVINFKMNRTSEKYLYSFTSKNLQSVTIEFTPTYPAGTIFKKALLNGKEIPFTVFNSKEYLSLLLKFQFKKEGILEIQFDKGISVLPVIADPKPGDPAEGLRILSASFKGNQYKINLEGKRASSESIEVYLHGQAIERIENGNIENIKGDIVRIGVIFEPETDKYVKKTIVITLK